MANTSSAKKAVRQAAKRTEVNKARRSRLRTFVRKVEEAIAAGDKSAAEAAFKEAQPVIMSSTHRGVLHHNTAARKISRLAQRIKTIQAQA
jgi:small subunit ribosomal protein S20